MMAYTYEDKLNFIADLYCPARVVADQTGCSWELILAQAAQETGWGEKVLPGTNNVFNIKADSSWKGESKVFHVRETIHKKTEWVDAPFRVYASKLESLSDRTKFLRENPIYTKSGLFKPEVKGNFMLEAQALKKAGYATETDYVDQLATVFSGPTMRRGIARAQERGCGPVLPMVEVFLLDGAKLPIKNSKVQVLLDGKQAEVVTDGHGRFVIRIAPKSVNIQLKVFDKDQNAWVNVDPVKLDKLVTDKTATLIAPTFTAQTSTREHEKKASPKPAAAPSAAPAATAPPAAKPAATGASAVTKFKDYKVLKGDSLASIASAHQTSYQAIAEANGISSPYIIRPDQILRVPDVKTQLAEQEKRHAAPPAAAHGAPAAHGTAAGKGAAQGAHDKPAAKPQQPAAPAANDHDGGSGGITLASLGQALSRGTTGLHTVFFRNAEERPQTDLMHSSRAPWMKFAQEEFEKGVKRRTGKGKNDARILEYFTATPSLDKRSASVDETPYCAAFVNWCLGRTGYKGNGSALAASFAKWGRPTKDNKPALGAVALIKFPTGGHHVTFVAGISPNGRQIATLGGNQGENHEVSHSRCPKTMVVVYRYPSDYPHYDDDYVLHDVESDHAPMTASSTH
ncbi:TIGR02594 family protein [Rugamonas aquatica]|uniref:Peptidoglycan hydrolase n=1 Tax=Rugamonas aquatica TaxID=2743357 RepID=A0A6A7N7G5_9BURK|nr:TIGR02594 family protein [Rugamonas aquatica]MQA40802.1 TIGR02594 family protein [Rugamonas aquatica]